MAEQVITPPIRSSGFRALMRHRNYAILWTSQGISLLGDRFHWVAISLWVYAQTGSALSVSYAVIALMVGPAAVGLFAGVLVDRWNRKWTMILADLVRAALVAIIPWLMSQDIRFVYLDLFLISCATAFFRPAMLATLPATVSKADLLAANSFLTAVDTATEVIGPVLAGSLVQTVGYSVAMYVDTASYLISGAIILLLSVPQSLHRSAGAGANRVFPDIGAGFRYVRRDRIQFGLLNLIFLGWWVSGLNSLQTPLAKGVFGLSDAQFGWFNGVWGVGFVLASLLIGWFGGRFPKGQLIAASFLGWAIATGMTGLSANVGMLFASVFWVGIANVVLFITLAATIMEITPSGMLGRVLTLRQVALAAVRVLAMLVFGKLADLAGVRIAVLSMSGISLLGIAFGFIAFPEVLRVDQIGRPAAPSLVPSGVGRRLRRYLVGTLIEGVDPGYPVDAQRVLNTSVLLIVGAAWIAIALVHPHLAAFVALTVGAAVVFRIIYRRWQGIVGSKNVRQGIPAVDSRESGQRRRSQTLTGPTVRQ